MWRQAVPESHLLDDNPPIPKKWRSPPLHFPFISFRLLPPISPHFLRFPSTVQSPLFPRKPTMVKTTVVGSLRDPGGSPSSRRGKPRTLRGGTISTGSVKRLITWISRSELELESSMTSSPANFSDETVIFFPLLCPVWFRETIENNFSFQSLEFSEVHWAI